VPKTYRPRRPVGQGPSADLRDESGVDLPKTTSELLVMLRVSPALRTELVDAGLKVWRESGRGLVKFNWRGCEFQFEATNFRFLVQDSSGRGLVERWH
jgi:hypothetical protein